MWDGGGANLWYVNEKYLNKIRNCNLQKSYDSFSLICAHRVIFYFYFFAVLDLQTSKSPKIKFPL